MKVNHENADLKVEVTMNDAGEPDSVMVAVAKKDGNNVQCNIGIVYNGKFQPFLEERVMEDDGDGASYFHLMGEVNRLMDAKGAEIQNDLRNRLAVMSLLSAIAKAAKAS